MPDLKTLIVQMEALAPRPKTIHAHACAHCPSAAYARGDLDDPSMADVRQWPRDAQIDSVFRCAWRSAKLCKGYCDHLNIVEADLP